MKHFIPKKTYYLKFFEILFLFLVISLGLFLYKYYNFSFFGEDNKFNTLSRIKYESKFKNKIEEKGLNSEIEKNEDLAKSIPILVYHGILERVEESDLTNTVYENFADQMIALKKNGWQTIRLDDFQLFIQGKKELPEKSFLITFDDGRKDSYYPVDPILEKLGYSATIFVIGENLKKESYFYLNEKELRQMEKSGRWEIQPHAFAGHSQIPINEKGEVGYFYANKIWLEEGRLETEDEYRKRVGEDIKNAKNKVEEIVGEGKAKFFAFPFGDYGQRSLNFDKAEDILIQEAVDKKLELFFYQERKFNYPENQKLIKRILMNEQIKEENLFDILEFEKEKEIPYSEGNFTNGKNWLREWGTADFSNGNMVLRTEDEGTGASVFLNGTKTWENYAFELRGNFLKGSNVVLLARVKDYNNYFTCNFSNDYLRMESAIDGKKEIIKEIKVKDNFFSENKKIYLGIRSDKNSVECMSNEKIISKIEISENSFYGGPGIKIWDKEPKNSELIIEEIRVENTWINNFPQYENL